MTAVYIIAGISAFILFLLFSDISVKVCLNKEFSAVVSFWFLSFRFPRTKKKKTSKKKRAKNLEKPNALKKMIDENGLLAAVSEIIGTTIKIVEQHQTLTKHIRITDLKINVVVASEDPAKTGVEYGAICSVIFPFATFLDASFKINRRKTNISVTSDFEAEKPKFYLFANLKAKVIYHIGFALKILFILFKKKYSEVSQKTKNNSQVNNSADDAAEKIK